METYLVARGRAIAPGGAVVSLPLPALADDVFSPPMAREPVAELAEVGDIHRPIMQPRPVAVSLPAPVAPPVTLAALKPAAAPAAPKPSPTPAAVVAAPAAAATPTAAAATSATKVREVFARVGDEIEIVLDGAGYLFLGFADRQTDSMTFKARTVKDGKTSFTFKALKLGTWDLDFQQQDYHHRNVPGGGRPRGGARGRGVRGRRAAPDLRGDVRGARRTLETGRVEWAEKLVALGKARQAIAEYLKGYREGNAGSERPHRGALRRHGRRRGGREVLEEERGRSGAIRRSGGGRPRAAGRRAAATSTGTSRGIGSCSP